MTPSKIYPHPSQSLIDAANDVIDSVNAQKRLKPPPPPKDNVDRACEMKKAVLARIEKLGEILPANTLDQARRHQSPKNGLLQNLFGDGAHVV